VVRINGILYHHAGKGVDMFKSKTPGRDNKAPANAAEATLTQSQHSVVAENMARPESTTKAGTVSCIGPDISIVGNVECNGAAQIFGRVEGELRASDVLIGNGAQVVGTVIAQEVTVCGRVKGTIRAVRVKLQGGGAVEGDIFHRLLSIDENAVFEGSSRRVENPTDPSSSSVGDQQKKDLQSVKLPPAGTFPSDDGDLQRHGRKRVPVE
jgi:cytoskeletal protein CcmA (bactofilin family)